MFTLNFSVQGKKKVYLKQIQIIYNLELGTTFVSMLSIQSRTKSGFPDRISSSDDSSYNWTFASTRHSGNIDEKCFWRHTALGIPTSALVATACRFSDESDTYIIESCDAFFRIWKWEGFIYHKSFARIKHEKFKK